MTKSAFKEFAKYSSLNVLGMLGLSCYILADTFFVSKGLGANGLAALNLAIPVYSFIHGSGLMAGIGGGTKYAIQKSQINYEAANRAFSHAVYICCALALLFVAIGLFFSDALAAFLGAEGQIYDMSRTYLQVILLFAPAFLFNNLLLCFVRNDGSPQLAMAAMITGSLSNVVLDWLFMFPFGMGIFGAVLATGLAPIISMALLSVHFIRRRNGFKLIKCRPDMRLTLSILSGGVPSLVTEWSSGIVMIAFNSIILHLEGNIGVAAYGVIANLSLVVIAIYTGIAQGIQPLISNGYGTGDYRKIKEVLQYAVLAMLLVSAAVYACVFFAASGIAGIFNSEGSALLQILAAQGMKLYFIACPFAGFNVIISMYFTSSERARPAHIISLLRGFIIIIPAAFILSRLAGLTGVWCAFPLTEAVVAVLGAAFYIAAQRRRTVCRI